MCCFSARHYMSVYCKFREQNTKPLNLFGSALDVCSYYIENVENICIFSLIIGTKHSFVELNQTKPMSIQDPMVR